MDQHQMEKEEIEKRANVCHFALECSTLPRPCKDYLHHCIEHGEEIAKKVNDLKYGKCESFIESEFKKIVQNKNSQR